MSTLREQLQGTRTELLLWHLITNPDPVAQRRIAFELGRRRAKEAVGYLQRLLEASPDARTRAAAAEALGEIGEESAGEDLIRMFCDDSQPVEVRDTCAYALARLRYEPALERLFRGLLDPAPSVRRCALSAIASIGGEADLELLGLHAQFERDPTLKAEMQSISAGHRGEVSFGSLTTNAPASANQSPPHTPPLRLIFSSRVGAA